MSESIFKGLARRLPLCLAILASTLAASLVGARPAMAAGDSVVPVEGQRIAREICAECHTVDPGDFEEFDVVPSFARIAADPAVTEISLRIFLRTPHWSMPNIMLTPAETTEIVDYILSLKGKLLAPRAPAWDVEPDLQPNGEPESSGATQ